MGCIDWCVRERPARPGARGRLAGRVKNPNAGESIDTRRSPGVLKRGFIIFGGATPSDMSGVEK